MWLPHLLHKEILTTLVDENVFLLEYKSYPSRHREANAEMGECISKNDRSLSVHILILNFFGEEADVKAKVTCFSEKIRG